MRLEGMEKVEEWGAEGEEQRETRRDGERDGRREGR